MAGYGYNPYTYQPMMNYQPMDRMAQIQQNYAQNLPAQYQQPQIPQQSMYGLNGQMVDSIDVVKAKDVDMSGAVTYYPQSTGEVIYTKQLQRDGTSRILTYRLEKDTPNEVLQQPMNLDALIGMFGQLKQDLLNEINGVKELVGSLTPASSPKATRGGSKE